VHRNQHRDRQPRDVRRVTWLGGLADRTPMMARTDGRVLANSTTPSSGPEKGLGH